ncbi:MAG TPA: OmpA family protein [Usitatibacteraceae bacterium]|nr:OmpA family protein [Usitatibacteraceae bacterium]
MKSRDRLGIIPAAVLGVLFSNTLVAQEAGDYYGGLSWGQTRARLDEQRTINLLLGNRATSVATSTDDKDSGHKIFGGYQLNRNFALEAGYVNLGKFRFASNTVPAGHLNGQLRLQGGNLDLVARAPLTDRLSLLGRVGATYLKVRGSFNGTGAVLVSDENPRTRKVNYKAGVGLQYALTPAVLARVEAERFRVEGPLDSSGRVSMMSVGLVFPFGGGRKPVAQVASAPVYIAPAPVPVVQPPAPVAPIAVAPVVQPPPERRQVRFSAESLFAFDRAVLRPEGRDVLDKFANDLRGMRFERISVEGHTDRLGTDAYNQKLSEERAQSVRSYLVDNGRLDASRISAVGRGESMPVTKAGECIGKAPNRRLIECLQPDRRVDVEVTASQ